MLDLSKFYSNNESSNFGEQYTIEEIKESQNGAKFSLVPCKDKQGQLTGKFFFSCGKVRGYVAQKTAEKISKKEPTRPLITSVVTKDDGKELLVLHEMGEGTIAVF